MKLRYIIWSICFVMLLPAFGNAQRRKKNSAEPVDTALINKMAADSAKQVSDSLAAIAAAKTADSLNAAVKDSLAKKAADSAALANQDCYQKWYNVMRSRGAKPVTDGMQQVVIALKGPEGANCFLGQIEVAGGKVKPPIFVQQENGEYKPLTAAGKKIDPAFATAMGEDQLYAISEGMSIVFRTTEQEYGRLFFYKFVNKSAQSNKTAPSPDDLIKD
jgi:hypothetical protein